MIRTFAKIGMACVGFACVISCKQQESNVERLPDIKPNLPAVPTLPPPPYPVQYQDGSYSVYGLRKRLRTTMDSEVVATAYIAEIYAPPVCPPKEECPKPAAPHMWVADAPGTVEREKRLMVVGYADNQEQIDEAAAKAKHGKAPQGVDPETGAAPVPGDFAVGNKVKVKGKFARISGSGFNDSEGLLEYLGHETLP